MSYENHRLRPFIFYSAIVDIVQIFGEMEIGSCEVDVEAVATYVSGYKFQSDFWGCSTKEDIYKKITDDILDGWPVWQFLKVSDWTKDMLERSFAKKIREERERLERTYKCYRCMHFEEIHTSLGVIEKCNWVPPLKPGERYFEWKRDSNSGFTLKKKCKNFELKENGDGSSAGTDQ